jgi:hypothetical protein
VNGDHTLGRTVEEAVARIDRELSQAAPAGWTVERLSGPGLAWRVFAEQEGPIQEYDVIVPASLDLIVFTHGNTDAGPFGLFHALQDASVIQASVLERFGIATCLRHVMSTCKPNTWGLT